MNLKKSFIKLSPNERLYQLDKPIIGLTGGIATGKSTVSQLLISQGIKVIDADQLVKSIYALKETKTFIQTNFPDAFHNDEISFPKLRELFFQDSKVKEEVETFIYTRLPQVFLLEAKKRQDQSFLVYDVPLLFEKKMDNLFDVKVVVYAPRNIQKARLLDRDKSREEIAVKILDSQMDIEEKKLKADYIVKNDSTLIELTQEVGQLVSELFN